MNTTKEFFEYDFNSALFPMETCRYLIGKGIVEIEAHIQRCLSKANDDEAHQFLAQTRVYASKPRNHLRRTMKLDPVSEFFIYDVIFRNRSRFRKPFQNDKKHFGYRFEEGSPIPVTSSYTGFKGATIAYDAKFNHSLSFDVATYFNGIYHHDIVAWFANLGVDLDDVNALGTFFRQCNSGRSIDCLPQGIYPTKMVGNDFLRFIEQHHKIKSSAVVRFMDDFVLYSDDQGILTEDFCFIQKLLGQKGLSVNPSKSVANSVTATQVKNQIDKVRANLLAKRREAVLLTYLDNFEAARKVYHLTNKEREYLEDLLKSQHLEEEDAELILSLFRDDPKQVQPHLPNIVTSFPHLAKNIWSFCRDIKDKEFIGELISSAADYVGLQEYQLFWFAWMLQDYAMDTQYAPEIISKLYNHTNSSIISKAKILEISDNRFGLVELRDEHLVAGRSDWLAWASAVGHRDLVPISRNHKLEYFANSSQINYLIKSIVARA